jgi:hypothetical protein
MNDGKPVGGYTPTNVLAKQGVTAVAGIAGGIALWVMGALPPLVGIIAGGVACVVGIGAILSKDPADKKAGTVITAGGFLAVAAKIGIPLIKPLAATLLGLGAIGFLGVGIWNGIKFFKGLKSRG